MKNRWWSVLTAIMLVLFISSPVLADMGPKPSISVKVRGIGDDICYATLLSETQSTGPASAYDGSDPRSETGQQDFDVWIKFVEFEDTDGYFYLQQHWTCRTDERFSWNYYPPDPFKVLLYFPEYDSFVVSGIIESYSFESYYDVDLSGIDYRAEGSVNTITPSPQYSTFKDVITIIFRLVMTLAIEVCLALLLKYREKKQILLIVIVNIITQILLNLMVNGVYAEMGFFFSMIAYVILEICVFIVEAITYFAVMKNLSSKPIKRWLTIFYALAANFLSFLFGFIFSILQLNWI
jgi:hypothetical protein